jgi:DNA-binding MarR family transcriptional regulator
MSTSSRTSVIHLLHRAAQRADALLEAELTNGLTARQTTVLSVIADYPGTNQTKIVEATGNDRSTLADITRRLHDRGLIKRARDRRDARAYRVHLTPQGQQALEAAAPAERRAMDMLLSSLTTQQRKDIATLLEALAGITESSEPDVEAPRRASDRK